MKNSTVTVLIDSFGVWMKDYGARADAATMCMEAPKRGFLVDPECSDGFVLDYIKSKEMNPNSTFYRTFNDVVSKSRFELFVDQCLHYISTYGTDYQGEVYCPNGEPINIDYNTYKVIKAVTREEMYSKVLEVLCSNVALADDTVNALVEFVWECVKVGYKLDIDSIKNKTAFIKLCDELGIVPNTGDGIIRMLAYYATGFPMLVQSRRNMGVVRANESCKAIKFIKSMTDEQLVIASKSFLRYKKFWLALRSTGDAVVRAKVNRIRQLARKNHQPMKIGFWENITNLPEKIINEHLCDEVEALDNLFKIIKLLEMIKLRRLQNASRSPRVFKIRNGRQWVDPNKFADYPPILDKVSQALLARAVILLREKRLAISDRSQVTIRFNSALNLMCPSSERNFIGNLPYGTSFDLADHDNYFGVYWRSEWGTEDFDLSLIADRGNKLGWNGSYYNDEKTLVFSGDMTSAHPEATEMFYAAGKVPNGTIYNNRYNGVSGSKFRLFFGQDACKGFARNYMVDPNTIKLSVDMTSEAAQQILGRIQDNKVYFCNFAVGESRISTWSSRTNEAMMDSVKAHIPLKELLLAAGFVEWDPESEEAPNIDLYDVKKDIILSLFN